MPQEEFFESRDQASTVAAGYIADALQASLRANSRAALVVSGGATPVDSLRKLAQAPVDWPGVTVTLSDERWVDPADDASNERMLRNTLLVGKAADARFLPLFRNAAGPAEACKAIDADIRELPLPFASVLLGMGEDGHFASLFPDASSLAEGLALDGDRYCLPVDTAASPHPRMSLTLAALTLSREIVLLFFGDAKRQVYEDARSPASPLPVSRLLNQTRAPVRVIWAP